MRRQLDEHGRQARPRATGSDGRIRCAALLETERLEGWHCGSDGQGSIERVFERRHVGGQKANWMMKHQRGRRSLPPEGGTAIGGPAWRVRGGVHSAMIGPGTWNGGKRGRPCLSSPTFKYATRPPRAVPSFVAAPVSTTCLLRAARDFAGSPSRPLRLSVRPCRTAFPPPAVICGCLSR